MTDLDLDAIEARLAAATDGPLQEIGIPIPVHWPFDDGETTLRIADTPYPPVAVFIAHARTDIEALVAEVRRLRTLISRMAVGANHGIQGLESSDIEAIWDIVGRPVLVSDNRLEAPRTTFDIADADAQDAQA